MAFGRGVGVTRWRAGAGADGDEGSVTKRVRSLFGEAGVSEGGFDGT
jgi:hypothetical protein